MVKTRRQLANFVTERLQDFVDPSTDEILQWVFAITNSKSAFERSVRRTCLIDDFLFLFDLE